MFINILTAVIILNSIYFLFNFRIYFKSESGKIEELINRYSSHYWIDEGATLEYGNYYNSNNNHVSYCGIVRKLPNSTYYKYKVIKEIEYKNNFIRIDNRLYLKIEISNGEKNSYSDILSEITNTPYEAKYLYIINDLKAYLDGENKIIVIYKKGENEFEFHIKFLENGSYYLTEDSMEDLSQEELEKLFKKYTNFSIEETIEMFDLAKDDFF